jgi:hypothetical protein
MAASQGLGIDPDDSRTESETEPAMLSETEILQAKKRTKYDTKEAHHEHDDCIRIAYDGLTPNQRRRERCAKHDQSNI